MLVRFVLKNKEIQYNIIMNETTPTIQNTLEKALIKSIDGIEKTGTELIEALYQQAPEVVEQLLM